MMNALERLFDRAARVMLWAGTLSLLVMTGLVVIASFMRYFVGRPFAFTEELVALLYMSMVFLGIPLVTVHGSHIAVSVMPQRLTRALGGPLRVGSALVMIVFCAWFTVEAYNFVEYSQRLHSKSEQVELLLWPWMAVIPVTMAFVTIIAAIHLFRRAPPPAAPEAGAQQLPLGDGL